jgi:hypothetical protein
MSSSIQYTPEAPVDINISARPMSHFQTIYIDTFTVPLTTIMYHLFLNISSFFSFSLCVCGYVCTHLPHDKSVIQACRMSFIFHINQHKFTAIASHNKYADSGREHRRSVKDILKCTFQYSAGLINTLQL